MSFCLYLSVSQPVNQPPFSESRSSEHPLTISCQAINTSRAGRTAISARPGPKPSPPSSFHLRTWHLLCFCAGLFPLAHSALLFGFLWPSERSSSQYRRNFETARRHQRAIHPSQRDTIDPRRARAEWEPEARPTPIHPAGSSFPALPFFFPPNRLRPIRLLKAVSHNVDIHIRRNSTAPQARNPGQPTLPTLPPLHLRPIHLGPELIAYLFHGPPLIFTSFLSHGGRPHFLCLLATIPLPFDHPLSHVGPCLVPRQPRHVSPLAGPPEPVRGHPGRLIACIVPARKQLGDRINHFRPILRTVKQTNTGPDSSRRP